LVAHPTGTGIELYIKPSAGTSEEQLLLGAPDSIKTPQDWSRDGKYLLYSSSKLGGAPDLWALPMFGAREPFPFVHAEQEASFSPDGKWVAYSSDESGRMEVYVSPFSPPTAAQRKRSGTRCVDRRPGKGCK
jgi:Tol biopolymer transport system component